MPNRYILHEKSATTLSVVNALKLQPENLVNEEVAAVIIDRHRVTLRVWRRQGRGPAYIKDRDGGERGDVRYRYGDLQEWLKANTVDPSKLTGMRENLYRLSRSSNVDRVRYETGETPSDTDVFVKV